MATFSWLEDRKAKIITMIWWLGMDAISVGFTKAIITGKFGESIPHPLRNRRIRTGEVCTPNCCTGPNIPLSVWRGHSDTRLDHCSGAQGLHRKRRKVYIMNTVIYTIYHHVHIHPRSIAYTIKSMQQCYIVVYIRPEYKMVQGWFGSYIPAVQHLIKIELFN